MSGDLITTVRRALEAALAALEAHQHDSGLETICHDAVLEDLKAALAAMSRECPPPDAPYPLKDAVECIASMLFIIASQRGCRLTTEKASTHAANLILQDGVIYGSVAAHRGAATLPEAKQRFVVMVVDRYRERGGLLAD